MSTTMAGVLLLEGDAAKAFISDINSAHVRPYYPLKNTSYFKFVK